MYEPGAGKEAENIYEYNEKDITLYEICESYGTPYKPPLDPKDDKDLLPEQKEPASPSKLEKTDEKAAEEEEKEEDAEGEPIEGEGDEPAALIEEEEEEEFIMPVHVTIWYDFNALNAGDPILLA